MKLLVLTPEPISPDQLREALPTGVEPTDAEVMVVAAALQDSPMKFWMSDVDKAIAHADHVRRETLERLGDEGVPAAGDTGESDPADAIQDALQTFRADRIVVFSHGEEGGRYREDVDPGEIEERFGVPVDRAVLSA
jgi:hypothetical protein